LAAKPWFGSLGATIAPALIHIQGWIFKLNAKWKIRLL